MALRNTIPRLQARVCVKKKVNGGGEGGARFSALRVSTCFQTKRYTYVWNLQIANQQGCTFMLTSHHI